MLYVPVPAVGSTVHGLQTGLRNVVNKRPLEIQNASDKVLGPFLYRPLISTEE